VFKIYGFKKKKKFDAGEIPKRTYSIFKSRRKFEIYNMDSISYVYIIPELYMVCEWSTLYLKEEGLNFETPPLERSPSAQTCKKRQLRVKWRYYAAQYFCLYTRQALFCSNWWFQRQMHLPRFGGLSVWNEDYKLTLYSSSPTQF
jgi:hypothetical protein